MQFQRFEKVQDFAARTLAFLQTREVENNLPIGILNRGIEEDGAQDWFMGCVANDFNEVALAALMTPPHNIILAVPAGEVSEAALDCLSGALKEQEIAVPGAIGEVKWVHAFAQRHAGRFHEGLRERIYRLDQVSDIPITGCLRPARETDMAFLPYWTKASSEDCFGRPAELDGEGARRIIERGSLFILEAGGQPVSMAGVCRKTRRSRVLGQVYTPPYFRNRGYGTSCVAMVSQRLLNEGNVCALFTDLANPTSNSIYQKIGYRPVCDVDELIFD